MEKNHWWFQARNEIIGAYLTSYSATYPIKTILDIGCGSGQLLHTLESNYVCTGVEPNDYLREEAIRTTNCTVIDGYLPTNIPFESESFDCIILLDVLEHIQDDNASLKKIYSLLKPNGLLLLNVPAMHILWSAHDEVNEHYRRYSQNELTSKLQKNNFSRIQTRYWGYLLAPIDLFIRKILPPSLRTHDLKIPPRIINRYLKKYATTEFSLLRKFNMPFGLSLIAVVSKH